MQNTKLIRRCIQGSCHIALCGRNLSHDRVVSKLCFLSLSHARKGLVDTKTQRNCFQSRLTQIVTKSTERFKLTRNTRLQLLHGIFIADVEEGTQVIAQLSQVLTHDVRTVTHYAEARSQGHENTLITHPLAGVNAHDLANMFSILLCFRSKLSHGSIEKVQVFYIFVRLIDELRNRPTNRLNSRNRHAKPCVKVHVRTCRRCIRSSQTVRARDYPLNPMRECREPAGNRIHLRCEGLQGGGKLIDLATERIKVKAVQVRHYFGHLLQCGNRGSQIGLSERSQRNKGFCQIAEDRKVNALQALSRIAELHDLSGNRGRNPDTLNRGKRSHRMSQCGNLTEVVYVHLVHSFGDRTNPLSYGR